MSDDDTVNVIKPPDTLSSKVSKGGPGAVDLAAIERAESVIANMADDYLDWVEDDLVKIANAQKELKANRDKSEEYLDKVFQVAHDMKGQGGSFGYDLMTILGNDLCRFIEGKKTASDVDIEVIDLYISTMQIVISKRMSGDGGPAGNEVLTGLAAVVAKITS
ncbi:MAG: Hpt domain-containing protein [Rhodospirillaceae bacterium]|nr:Hpt domain-containing protein [Rhodospirillaceae bacterium]MBL6941698.1 Hpt domain-containing protein [Rhodospirillales bacterium]